MLFGQVMADAETSMQEIAAELDEFSHIFQEGRAAASFDRIGERSAEAWDELSLAWLRCGALGSLHRFSRIQGLHVLYLDRVSRLWQGRRGRRHEARPASQCHGRCPWNRAPELAAATALMARHQVLVLLQPASTSMFGSWVSMEFS